MIQVGSRVRVVRPGRFELRGEVVATGSARRSGRRMVKVRLDPDHVAVAVAPGELDRWFEVMECIEENVMPDPPAALLPRPTWDDVDALRVLSDQLEEQGNDAGAALLRDVAGRIQADLQTREGLAEFARDYGELRRLRYGKPSLEPPAERS